MTRLLDLSFRIQKRLWKWIRPRTRGVKVMLFNGGGDILLIRNSYGDSHLWVLPGGGIRPWESPERAAAREVREELGCRADGLTLVSTHSSTAEGKRDTIHLFKAQLIGDPTPDDWEVIEARFFAPSALPSTASPATGRRIEEYVAKRSADGSW